MWAISHVCSHFSIAIWLRYESAQARIAALTGFDKEEIEGCLREVVLALAERLDAPEGISLEFVGIGRLSLRLCVVAVWRTYGTSTVAQSVPSRTSIR
jgi:hypothetical protein